MISTISSALENTPSSSVQKLPLTHQVPSSSSSTQGSSLKEDTVQLSAETQQQLANSKPATAKQQQPSFEQIVKEAADGDISALAQLALIA